ncbi:MAG: MFS transporter [Lachnospiraceae bacterium]|nr:MFS transporter [Lachnospiraceae bacterium]
MGRVIEKTRTEQGKARPWMNIAVFYRKHGKT